MISSSALPDGDRSPPSASAPDEPVASRTRSIKVVIIGDSGTGKTSLRNQYLTKRFSQSYKATIGCDFVTAFVPLSPETTATLSIWDTAGQERFASLSTAFFRGSDAAILVYDVTKPETLANLRRWFGVFEDRCPVEGLEGKRRFCFLVVGNKGDLASTLDSGSGHLNDFNIVKEEDARALFNELIPPRPQPPSSPSSAPADPSASSAPHSFSDSSSNQGSSSPSSAFSSALNSVTTRIRSFSSATPTARASSPGPSSSSHHLVSSGAVPTPSSPSTSSAPQDVHSSTLASIEIVSSPPASGPSTLTTTTSIYHDALSSFCDPSTSSPRQNGSASNPVFPPPSSVYSFSTARSDGSSACGSGPRPTSPVNSSALPSVFSSSSPLSTSPAGAGGFPKWDLRLSSKRAASIASMSSSLGSSTSTIRPANAQPRSTSRSRPRKASGGSSLRPKMTDHGPRGETSTEDPLAHPAAVVLEPPAEYPAFFPFVSAKTGAGVSELFEYIARRVVERWEWEESGAGSEWGGCGVDDGEGVDLGGGKGKKKMMGGCC